MSEITISHKVEVDECIEKEILELNNEHNILTLYSCCGHKKGNYGYICVHEHDEENILQLGYVKNGIFKTEVQSWNLDKLSEYTKGSYYQFKPKSKCTGLCKGMSENLKESKEK